MKKELTELFKTALTFPTNVRLKIVQIENYASAANSSAFRKNAASTLAERINELKSKDENLPDDKKLNFDIWYNPKNNLIIKVSYSKMGNWEYRLKNFE